MNRPHYQQIADAEFADRHAENMARTNVEHDNHMPPGEIESMPQKILTGISYFLLGLLIVLFVAFSLAQI